MVVKFGCLVYLTEVIVGFLGGSVMKVDIFGSVKKKMGDFRFWIESDVWRVYSCFMYLYTEAILWKQIQGSLVSL